MSSKHFVEVYYPVGCPEPRYINPHQIAEVRPVDDGVLEVRLINGELLREAGKSSAFMHRVEYALEQWRATNGNSPSR